LRWILAGSSKVDGSYCAKETFAYRGYTEKQMRRADVIISSLKEVPEEALPYSVWPFVFDSKGCRWQGRRSTL